MPCADNRSGGCDDYYKPDLDKVTRLLCELCDRVDKWELHTELISESSELSHWLAKHRRADMVREAAEREHLEHLAKRKKILDGLTQEVKDFLNLK